MYVYMKKVFWFEIFIYNEIYKWNGMCLGLISKYVFDVRLFVLSFLFYDDCDKF